MARTSLVHSSLIHRDFQKCSRCFADCSRPAPAPRSSGTGSFSQNRRSAASQTWWSSAPAECSLLNQLTQRDFQNAQNASPIAPDRLPPPGRWGLDSLVSEAVFGGWTIDPPLRRTVSLSQFKPKDFSNAQDASRIARDLLLPQGRRGLDPVIRKATCRAPTGARLLRRSSSATRYPGFHHILQTLRRLS